MAKKSPRHQRGRGTHKAPIRRATVPAPAEDTSNLLLWCFGIVIALAAVIAPYGQTRFGYNPDHSMAGYLQVSSAILLFAYLMYHLLQRRQNTLALPLTSLLWPVLALYLWMALSLTWAINFYEGIVKILDWGAGITIFLLALFLARPERTFPILFCVFVSGFITGLIGVSQYIFALDWVLQQGAPASTFGNKNMAAQYMLMTISAGICIAIAARKKSIFWFCMPAVSIMAAYIFFIQSRGSWVAFIVQTTAIIAIFIYLKIKHGYRPFWNREKSLSLALAVALLVGLVNLSPTTFSDGSLGVDNKVTPTAVTTKAPSATEAIKQAVKGIKGSAEHRLAIWDNTLAMFKDFPIVGTGIGNWMVFYPKYQAVATPDMQLTMGIFHINTHDDYLEFLSELGIIGGILILWLVVTMLSAIGRVLASDKLNDDNRPLVVVPIAVLISISVSAVFSFPLQQPVTIALFALYLGLLAANFRWSRQSPPVAYQLPLPPRPYRIAVLAVLGASVLGLGILRYQWEVSEAHYQKAYASALSGNHKQMGTAINQAIEANPLRADLHRFKAFYYARTKQHKRAVAEYEIVRKDYPYMVRIMENMGQSYQNAGQTEKARELFELWQQIQPHSPEPFVSSALLAHKLGDREKAIELAKQAKQIQKEKGQNTNKIRHKMNVMDNLLRSLGVNENAEKGDKN